MNKLSLSILRGIPVVSIGLILAAKVFFPQFTYLHPVYLISIIVLVTVSLTSVILLGFKKEIPKTKILLLIFALIATLTIFYFQYSRN